LFKEIVMNHTCLPLFTRAPVKPSHPDVHL
jgi:hypothetical protein